MTGQRHEGTADAMIKSDFGIDSEHRTTAASGHRPTSAEVAYRIATVTAVFFLLATVI